MKTAQYKWQGDAGASRSPMKTWREIKDRFEGNSLGDLEVKGTGTIRIVAVQARSPKSSDQDSESMSRPA